MQPTTRPKRVNQRRKARSVLPRRRKHSYLTRKVRLSRQAWRSATWLMLLCRGSVLRQEEMERLEQDAESLEEELERVKKQTEGSRARFRPIQDNAAMKELLRAQKLSLWGVHATLSNRLVRHVLPRPLGLSLSLFHG